jgi:DNA polymerase (family 10)
VGVNIVIDTDSHHTGDLVRMDYGVRYAQRGWVTTDRVLNARPVDQVLAWVAARRE